MVAYTLPADTNVTAVADGRRWGLLAAPRQAAGRHRHAAPRDGVQLSTARTAKRGKRLLPDAVCVYSGLVRFASDGVVRVVDAASPPYGDFGEAMANLLRAAEQGAAGDRAVPTARIAHALGFRDYAALWAAVGGDDGEVIARQVVAWSLV